MEPGISRPYERMVSMDSIKSKWQGRPNYEAGFSPSLINDGLGMQAGTDSNGAGAGLEQYSQLIGKPLISKGENLVQDKDEQLRRKRARRANEILRSLRHGAGLHAFFFDKFLVWSDYVEGKLDEEEFTQRVREEVELKAKTLEN